MRYLLFPLLLVSALTASDSTTPGEVTSPFPTINHLAVEWAIEGDDNLNAGCAVRYRQSGGESWQQGPPLRRVPAGSSRGTSSVFTWSNRLSGSLFDLRHGGRADLNSVKPGEVLLLADGDYGAVTFNRDGEPGKPIVYRSLSGKAVFSEIGLTNRKWVSLEGLTINGPVRMNGTEHCVVRRCTIRSQYGIKAYRPGMMNACIEDNIITGIQPWKPEIMGAGGDNEGEGIQFTGSGNVIRHNRVEGFRDGISHMEDDGAVAQQCNDILNNDIRSGLDDGIEADFALHNCRILRNRLTNCFVGISSQPGLGGPNYFQHNVMFNIVLSAFKLHRYSQGDVILHNTVIKAGDGLGIYTSEPFDHARIEHNLFIGGKAPEADSYGGYSPGRGRAVDVQRFGDHCRIDHNTYVVVGRQFEGKIGSWTFTGLPGPVFETRGRVAEGPVPFPSDPATVHEPPDFEAVHRAIGFDDGEPAPVYGPR